MGDSWVNCQSCGHRYGSWLSACPQCGSKNAGFKKKGLGKGKKIAIGAGIAVVAFFAFVIVVDAFVPTPQPDSVSTQATNQESSSTNSVIQAPKEPSQNNDIQTNPSPSTDIVHFNGIAETKVDNLAFRVQSAELSDGPIGPINLPIKPNGRFVILTVTTENQGKESKSIYYGNFQLIDNEGHSYDSTSLQWMVVNSPDSNTVNPGLESTNKVPFDVPADHRDYTLKVTGNSITFEGEGTISLGKI